MDGFAQNLKRIRGERGLTQAQLAEKIHVTRQAISNWENEKCEPDISNLNRLADILGTDINELLYGIKAYAQYQRRYLNSSGISAGVIIVTLVFYLYQYRVFLRAANDSMDNRNLIALFASVPQIACFALGIFILSLISLKISTVIKKPLRIAAIAAGALLALFLLLIIIQCITWTTDINRIPVLYYIIFSRHSAFAYRALIVLVLRLAPAVSGALLFLGINH